MKTSCFPWTYVLPAAALALTQCQDKQEAEGGKDPESTALVEEVAQGLGEIIESQSSLSAEERAKIVPITALAKGDVDGVASLIDLAGGVEKLRALKLWEFIRTLAQSEGEVDLEAEIGGALQPVAPFAGEEVSIIYGKGTSDFVDVYMDAGQRINYYQLRALAKGFAEGAVSGDFESAMSEFESGAYFAGLIDEVEDFVPQLRELRFPPMVFSTKISDEAARQQAVGQINGLLAMVAPQGEEVAFPAGGAQFSGVLLSGEPLADQMGTNPGDLIARFGEETAKELIEIVREKRLVLATGVVASNVMVYLGPDVESCPLTESIEDSLAGNERISFIDGYKDLEVHGFLYGSKETLEAAFKTDGMGSVAEGIIAGLKDAEGFGDPREVISLLGLVEERSEAVYSFYKPETFGGVVSVNQGFVFETFGGYESGALDYGAAHRLGSLGEGGQTLLFADSVVSPEYQEALTEYLDLLVTIAYSTAEHVATLQPAGEEMAQYGQMFQLFNEHFREDLLKLWNGVMLTEEGLGNERALVIDLAGGVPSMPGVPPVLVEEGRLPRATYLAPVTDRAKLGESWKEIDASLRSLLATAGEMGGLENLNMLVPTSSEKNDLVTWYFDAAAFSDDLKPSVTVSDEWFAVSTSRTQALDLIAKASAAEEATRTGAWLKLDTNVLAAYLSDLATLVEEKGEEVAPDAEALEQFRERLPVIREGIAAIEELDAVTIHDREENGTRRMTFKISAD